MGKAFEENEFTHNLGLDQTSLKKSSKPLKCRLFGRLLPSEVLIQRTGYNAVQPAVRSTLRQHRYDHHHEE